MDRQLFVLGPDVWPAMDPETVKATAISMHDAGIYAPPYKQFDLTCVGVSKHIFKWIFPDLETVEGYEQEIKDIENELYILRFRYQWNDDGTYHYWMAFDYKKEDPLYFHSTDPELLRKFSNPAAAKDMNDLAADCFLTVLVVLLATKNSDKKKLVSPKRYDDPSSFKGIKKIKNTLYNTIVRVSVGKITESMTSGANRGPVRPHLRRGHIRLQHFGPGRKETKKIFIHPVFVNADEGWIENQRKEYRIKA